MGLLSADLERYRLVKLGFSAHPGEAGANPRKSAPPQEKTSSNSIDHLRSCLERFSGADQVAEKTASTDDLGRLHQLHRDVEAAYRGSVKMGKRPEADALLDKFAGWKYLKGQPGEAGDLHPIPTPDEK